MGVTEMAAMEVGWVVVVMGVLKAVAVLTVVHWAMTEDSQEVAIEAEDMWEVTMVEEDGRGMTGMGKGMAVTKEGQETAAVRAAVTGEGEETAVVGRDREKEGGEMVEVGRDREKEGGGMVEVGRDREKEGEGEWVVMGKEGGMGWVVLMGAG